MKKLFLILLVIPLFCYANNIKKDEIASFLINDEVDVFISGGESLLNKEIPTVNASKLINEYKENQLVYENNYDGKVIRIKTVVSGIKTTITKQAYIEANGKNKFESVSLYVDRKDKDILNLKVGDKIDMICLGTSNNVIYPFLKECIFTKAYGEKFKKSNYDYLSKTVINQDKPSTLFGIYYKSLVNLYLNDDQIKNIIDNKEYKKLKSEEFNEKINQSMSAIIEKYTDDELQSLKLALIPNP